MKAGYLASAAMLLACAVSQTDDIDNGSSSRSSLTTHSVNVENGAGGTDQNLSAVWTSAPSLFSVITTWTVGYEDHSDISGSKSERAVWVVVLYDKWRSVHQSALF